MVVVNGEGGGGVDGAVDIRGVKAAATAEVVVGGGWRWWLQ